MKIDEIIKKNNLVLKRCVEVEPIKEYDENGNLVHLRDNEGYEEWREFSNDNKITRELKRIDGRWYLDGKRFEKKVKIRGEEQVLATVTQGLVFGIVFGIPMGIGSSIEILWFIILAGVLGVLLLRNLMFGIVLSLTACFFVGIREAIWLLLIAEVIGWFYVFYGLQEVTDETC